ncbi:YdcH family protein [Microvirga terricola]|uniref:DUF465 domain-containing protein n=1 Tax=Microvirga terricola TaxID=2719797 RepID=A0ABX0VB29_9HYPH|nr:DUF465 domain-containing protein [Microvirga terricola]NIX76903.1 DUF465 domain-containing protein [Microvirga terricola]
MSKPSDDLEDDFPNQADRIARLTANNPHFARLLEKYRELNHAIHALDTHLDPKAQDEEEALKMKRVQIKDALAAILAKESA